MLEAGSEEVLTYPQIHCMQPIPLAARALEARRREENTRFMAFVSLPLKKLLWGQSLLPAGMSKTQRNKHMDTLKETLLTIGGPPEHEAK